MQFILIDRVVRHGRGLYSAGHSINVPVDINAHPWSKLAIAAERNACVVDRIGTCDNSETSRHRSRLQVHHNPPTSNRLRIGSMLQVCDLSVA